MIKTALLFAGQGSQYAGMGRKLQEYSPGRETFQEARDTSGIDFVQLCCNGTDDDLRASLSNTEITQPVILTCSIAALRILKAEGKIPAFDNPLATAGLSVGEYSALVASESLSFTDALRLVKERGRLMAEAAAMNPGIMVAILGLDNAVVESICKEASVSGVVWPANYNCPGQVVISGEEKAVQKAMELAQKAGAKKCKPLNVSGAFHSALMLPAESGLRKALNNISVSEPKIPFISNVTGDYLLDPEGIRSNLALQLSNPIQWENSIRRMVDDGITTFAEIGPGKVLAGLVRRIHRDAEIYNSDDLINK